MESVWSVSKLSTESVGSRRELVANCVHTADADATKQFRRVGGVYWALHNYKLLGGGLMSLRSISRRSKVAWSIVWRPNVPRSNVVLRYSSRSIQK